MNTHHIPPPDGYTLDDVYQALLADDETLTEESVATALEDLSDGEFLTRVVYDDELIYRGRDGLKWADFHHLVNPLHKQILLQFAEDPATWMLLLNTQKGKLRKMIDDIRPFVEAARRPDAVVKPVIVIYAANDRELAGYARGDIDDQFAEGTVKTILLSSGAGSTVTFEEIRTHIDAYANDDEGLYGVPILVVLANTKQNEKIVKVLHHIVKKSSGPRGSRLRYAIYFDEADQTYPKVRDLVEPSTSTTLGAFVANEVRFRIRAGWISATDGDLLNVQVYPECATAPVLNTGQDDVNYRAIHTSDSTVHRVPHPAGKSHNDYASSLLTANSEHFFSKYRTRMGTLCYRKTIINGSASIAKMTQYASDLARAGTFAITFNMNGVRVYFPDGNTKTYKTKGWRFGKLLFYIYKMNRLHTRPLFVIGRLKVNRGLGFHWAPRGDGVTSAIVGQDGTLAATGIDSLIWTDVILGKIIDKDTAVQKAGRGAGIIAHCPHFPEEGGIHYWTTSETAALILTHNERVDAMNDNSSGRSILQAMEVAKREVPDAAPEDRDPRYSMSIPEVDPFATVEDAKAWVRANFVPSYGPSAYRRRDETGNETEDGMYIQYRGSPRRILALDEVRRAGDIAEAAADHARIMPVEIGQGANTSARIMPIDVGSALDRARIMPVEDGGRVAYIVIYKPDFRRA